VNPKIQHLIFLVLASFIVIGCAGSSGSGGEVTPTPIPTPIEPTKPTYLVERGDVVKSLRFNGRLVPVEQQNLYFRVPGYIGKVYVKRGDEVKAGDVLAELDVTDIKNQLLQAEAALALAQANNAQQISEAEIYLQMAQLNLENTKAEDPSAQVSILEIPRAKALEEFEKVKKQVEQAGGLEKASQYLVDLYREAELNYLSAEAEYQQAVDNVTQHQNRVALGELEVTLAEMHLKELQEGMDIQEMELGIQRLKDQLTSGQLISPIDGNIVTMNLFEGKEVSAYVPLVVVADIANLEIGASLRDDQLTELEEGMTGVCTASSHPGEDIACVIRMLPYPYGSASKETTEEDEGLTRIEFVDSEARPDLEMSDLIQVVIEIDQSKDSLWLPLQAIRTFEGRKFVVIQDDEGQHRVDVKLGLQGDDRVEILEGVSEGQLVIGK